MTCVLYCLLIIWMVVSKDTFIPGQMGAITNMKGLL